MSLNLSKECSFRMSPFFLESLASSLILSLDSRLTARIAISPFLIFAWNQENWIRYLDSLLLNQDWKVPKFLSFQLSIYLSVCLSIGHFICWSVNQSVNQSVYPYYSQFIGISVFQSIHLHVCPMMVCNPIVCQFIHLSISLSVKQSFHMSVHLFVCTSAFPSKSLSVGPYVSFMIKLHKIIDFMFSTIQMQ